MKQPDPKAFRDRYRRLCEPCVQAPLKDHINPSIDPDSPTALDLIKQGICYCDTKGVWLCQPCGLSIRNKDQTYLRSVPTHKKKKDLNHASPKLWETELFFV